MLFASLCIFICTEQILPKIRSNIPPGLLGGLELGGGEFGEDFPSGLSLPLGINSLTVLPVSLAVFAEDVAVSIFPFTESIPEVLVAFGVSAKLVQLIENKIARGLKMRNILADFFF